MPAIHRKIRLVFVLLLVSTLLLHGRAAFAAPRMVSIAKDNVNMRSGPGTDYQVLWKLYRGYPLKIITSKGAWYEVRDFEGDTGWVHSSVTWNRAYMVVKKDQVNIRSQPDTASPVVAQAERGSVFRTVAVKNDWVRVRHENGIDGWVAKWLVWGW